jgi:hypothetical protein
VQTTSTKSSSAATSSNKYWGQQGHIIHCWDLLLSNHAGVPDALPRPVAGPQPEPLPVCAGELNHAACRHV